MKSQMNKSMLYSILCVVLMLSISMLSGCAGNDGAAGAPGVNGTDATQPLNGGKSSTENLQAQITDATLSAGTGSLVVTFKLLDEAGAPLDPRDLIATGGRCRFYVAQIDATGNYKNYFGTTEAPSYDSASNPSAANAAASTAFAATADPGVYTFTFSKNITASTSPLYDAALTHTVAAQITRTIISSKGVSLLQSVNPYFNFRPDGNAVTVTREIVAVSNCNECHGRITGHGSRVETALCILCHNPGAVDEDGVSVDFKSMIHKIHMGINLKSNKAGAVYTLNGGNFATVVYPAKTGDSFSDNTPMECTKCHKAGKDAKGNTYGADVDRWKTNPTRDACTTCHDLTTFDNSTTIEVFSNGVLTTMTAVPHNLNATAQPDDSLCAVCHSETESLDYSGSTSVPAAHLLPLYSNLNTGLVFNITQVEAASGSTITVHFTVKDGTGAPYDLLGATAVPGSSPTVTYADSCAIVFAYMTGADYDNTDPTFVATKKNRPNQFFEGDTKTISSTSVNPATLSVGTGQYIATMNTTTVPNVVGVGTIAVYGKKGIAIPFNEATAHRSNSQHNTAAYGVGDLKPSAFYSFNLADGAQATESQLRREVVSIDKCNKCHTNWNSHSRADTKVCVMCHGPNLYEKNYKGFSASGNLKDFVHSLHGAQVLSSTTTTNFHGTEKIEGFPNDVRNCLICHISDPMTMELPLTAKGSIWSNSTQTALPPTEVAGPVKAACTSCHDSAATKAHADLNTLGGAEACAVCHASGKIYGNAHAPVK